MRKLATRLQAQPDVEDAAIWYESKRPGLGLRFLDQLSGDSSNAPAWLAQYCVSEIRCGAGYPACKPAVLPAYLGRSPHKPGRKVPLTDAGQFRYPRRVIRGLSRKAGTGYAVPPWTA